MIIDMPALPVDSFSIPVVWECDHLPAYQPHVCHREIPLAPIHELHWSEWNGHRAVALGTLNDVHVRIVLDEPEQAASGDTVFSRERVVILPQD